jgi:hypothetical protein
MGISNEEISNAEKGAQPAAEEGEKGMRSSSRGVGEKADADKTIIDFAALESSPPQEEYEEEEIERISTHEIKSSEANYQDYNRTLECVGYRSRAAA